MFNENNQNYARMKAREDVSYIDSSRDITNEIVNQRYKEDLSDFMDFYVNYVDYNYSHYLKRNVIEKLLIL